jgi:hypothetical protein
MELIKAFYIDVEAQKISELYLSFTWHNLQYFLRGNNITLACLGEEAEYMIYLNRLNFRRKKAGFFKLTDISEELYPGNGLLFSINLDFDKSLVFENVSISIESFSKTVAFFRPNQITETHIIAKIR